MARKLTMTVLLGLMMIFIVISYVTVLRTDYRVTSAFVNFSLVLLFSFLVILILRFFILIYLSYLHHVDRARLPDMLALYRRDPSSLHLPTVSVIVPCYNEGVVIEIPSSRC